MYLFERIKKRVKTMGWKLALGIFAYYLIRDLTIYVIIPYLLASQIL